jgi:hypothetical protein
MRNVMSNQKGAFYQQDMRPYESPISLDEDTFGRTP